VVFHVTSIFSLFANASDNRNLPSFNEHVVGGTPPMPKGFGTDFGVKINLFDGKLYATIGYYTTNYTNVAEWGNAETYSNLNNRILDKFVSDGLISQADANSHYTSFDSYLFDKKTKGWEAEIIANPDEHWRFTLNASINRVIRTKMMNDLVAWANAAKAYWVKTGGSENYLLSSNSWDKLGGDDIKDGQIYWMDQYLDSQTAFDGKQAAGEREYSGSLYARYTFTESFLKGFYIGGGSRYQSANAVAYVNNVEIKGNDILLFDAMAGYDFTIRSGDNPITASIQLNVSNVFDDNTYQIYTVAWWNSSIPERIGLQEPRKFTLTAKLNF
jgi:outer membrane receptor for ferric coprogen and ferric-rhodotorulic acid